MSLALYRKYRPQRFAEIVGQNHIKVTVQNELAHNRLAHAYLFSGPRGLGKTTIARLIAKSVNCLNRKPTESEPCNHCAACEEITAGQSLDVIEIDAASHTGVDNVRENIIANARFTPTNRTYKVFIIDEVHMLSTSAFNALLKTLEEPPAHALFLLATTEIHKIPQTIISRCQRFDFRKVSQSDLVARLADIVGKEKRKVDQDVLQRIARFADGGVRDAESLLGQVLAIDEKNITADQAELVIPASQFNLVIDLVAYLLKRDATSSLLLVNKLLQDGIDIQKFTSDLIEVLRKFLLRRVSPQLDEYAINLENSLEKELVSLLEKTPTSQFVAMIDIFIKAQQQLKSAEIIQLPLELAVVEICQQPNDNNNDSSANDNHTTGDFQQSALTKPKKSAKNTPAAVQAIGDTAPPARKAVEQIVNLSLKDVKSRWVEVLDRIKDYNQSLASTLKHHLPTAIKPDGAIEISFKYKFYQQRVAEAKNVQLLEQALAHIFQLPLRVETVLVKRLPAQDFTVLGGAPESTGQALDSLAQQFGGQVVD